jgi:hypothetical protein
MDKKMLATLALGAALGGGTVAGTVALAKPQAPTTKAVSAQLTKRDLNDGGVEFFVRTIAKEIQPDGGEQRSLGTGGIVIEPTMAKEAERCWSKVIEPSLTTPLGKPGR